MSIRTSVASTTFNTFYQDTLTSVPNVTIVTPAIFPLTDPNEPTADAGATPTWTNHPQITATNVHEEFLRPEYDLRVELLWYKGRKRKLGQNRGGAGFKHPTHYVGGNSHPHPGADTHNGGVSSVTGDRVTEWLITSRNQRITVNLAKFLRLVPILAQDSGGNFSVNCLVPAWIRSQRGGNNTNNLKKINGRLQPLYVCFRYSIFDIKRGKGRIVGPLSKVVAVSNKRSPILRDFAFEYANLGRRAYTLNGSFNVAEMQCNFDRRNKIA